MRSPVLHIGGAGFGSGAVESASREGATADADGCTGQLDVEMRRLAEAGGREGSCCLSVRFRSMIMELRGAVCGRLHAARRSSWVKLHRSGWMETWMGAICRFPGVCSCRMWLSCACRGQTMWDPMEIPNCLVSRLWKRLHRYPLLRPLSLTDIEVTNGVPFFAGSLLWAEHIYTSPGNGDTVEFVVYQYNGHNFIAASRSYCITYIRLHGVSDTPGSDINIYQ